MSNPLTPAVLSQWFSSSVFTLDYWDYGEWLLEDSLMLVSYVELVENRKHVWKFDSLSLVLSLAVFICDSLLLLWVMRRELKAPCSGPPVCECFVRISLIKLCLTACCWSCDISQRKSLEHITLDQVWRKYLWTDCYLLMYFWPLALKQFSNWSPKTGQ